MMFRVRAANVPGTRNIGKPHGYLVVPGVPGVPCVYTREIIYVCVRDADVFVRTHAGG